MSESEAMAHYKAAKAAGRLAEATSYVLEYMEQTKGETDPLTVNLTHTYGNQLREESDFKGAVEALKLARERGIEAYGEYGVEMYWINLDLGEAYVDRNIGAGRPKKYFDDALEVLRQNGQRETMLYVSTLLGAASRLASAGALGGTFSSDTYAESASRMIRVDANQERGRNESGAGMTTMDYRYRSGSVVLEAYIEEALELAEILEDEDPYLGAKIAVVQAKIKTLDNVYLDVVPATVKGSVSGTEIGENYQREDDNLLAAIDILAEDSELNGEFLQIANSARMDIAWLSEDMAQMRGFCSSNTLNMAAEYPPDRLFEVADDGSVISPRFSFRISTNIFDRPEVDDRSTRLIKEDERVVPQFIPVCINGRLMAALVNTPVVIIEDFE